MNLLKQIAATSLVSWLVTALVLFFTLPGMIQTALLEHEYKKVGGKDNYNTITTAQILALSDENNTSNIENYKAYITSQWQTTTDPNQVTQNVKTDKVMDQSQVDEYLKGLVIEGNKNSDVVVIEYSDFECPFCIMGHMNKNLDPTRAGQGLKELLASDGYSFSQSHNRGVDHSGTEYKGIVALCAQKVWGENGYIKMVDRMWTGNKGYNASEVLPVGDLKGIGLELGFNEQAWNSCIDNTETLEEFNRQTSLAMRVQLTGTPGFLILNKKTGVYETVLGMRDYNSFITAINKVK